MRPVARQEIKATTVTGTTLVEVSAKVRRGPPIDDEAGYELDVWAGVLPIGTAPGAPEPGPHLTAGIAAPTT